MAKQNGLWVAVGGIPLADDVKASIERDNQFTTTVSTAQVRPRVAELVVVSLHDTGADYVGISQAGRLVATGQIAITVSHLVALQCLKERDIRSKLPTRFAGCFDPPMAGVSRLTPRLWEEVLKIIAAERPEVGRRLVDLKDIVAASHAPRGRFDGGLEVFERDAVAAALQTWGNSAFRKRVLRTAVPSRAVPVAPFLSQLEGASVREDIHIAHDHATFPGMEIARRDVVGSLVLRAGEECLTILNCNRQPLEHTLGVDLIYYNHGFDSFVLVQYKRMTDGADGSPEYYPNGDRSHATELQRMTSTAEMLRALPRADRASTREFRLSGQPFYLKLCESKARSPIDSGMVSGMYVPLGLWHRMLKSPESRGARGGVRITWENCKRRFNNSEFTNLLRHGWIGSAAGQSDALSQIIEGVLSNGRMLILAATSAADSSLDLRRDSFGRFAAADDPSGGI